MSESELQPLLHICFVWRPPLSRPMAAPCCWLLIPKAIGTPHPWALFLLYLPHILEELGMARTFPSPPLLPCRLSRDHCGSLQHPSPPVSQSVLSPVMLEKRKHNSVASLVKTVLKWLPISVRVKAKVLRRASCNLVARYLWSHLLILSPCSLYSHQTLKCTKHTTSASGPLHWLSTLPGLFFP